MSGMPDAVLLILAGEHPNEIARASFICRSCRARRQVLDRTRRETLSANEEMRALIADEQKLAMVAARIGPRPQSA